MSLRLGTLIVVVFALVWLVGCQDNLLVYLTKQGFRQGSLLLSARPIEEVLKDPGLDPRTEKFLHLSQEVLVYADGELGMRTGRSYRKFVNLDRPWVTQIVMAAPKDKLESYLFRYPIFGGLPYKGFFDEEDAIRLEKKLEGENLDVYRREVEAFSTTGWLPDPLLSSMLSEEARLIELLFHELTHTTFYFNGEADFNEAFASWMGHRAALDFISAREAKDLGGGEASKLRERITKLHAFQTKLAVVVREIVARGRETYSKGSPADLESRRKAYFNWIRERIAREPDFSRLADRPWNNALILSLSTYYELVPAIDAYAEREKLTPRAYLARVRDRGPAIMAEILATKAP